MNLRSCIIKCIVIFKFSYDGYGELRKADLSYCIGTWKSGLKHGKVKELTSNGELYEGEYKNDKRHRIGKLQCSFGACESYEGEWQEGKRHGYGTEYYRSGNFYQGEFLNGKKHGKGIFTYKDQTTLSGSWARGTLEGYATAIAGPETKKIHDFGSFRKVEVHAEGYFAETVRHGKFRISFNDTTYMD